MRRPVTNAEISTIASMSRAWRWTQLHDKIVEKTGCCPSTARRAINRGIQLGLLQKHGSTYQAASSPAEKASGHHYQRLDRHQMLQVLAEREEWPYTIMLATLRTRLGAAESTIRTSIGYARAFRYLEKAEGGWALSQTARDQLAHYGRLQGAEGFRFAAFLSGQPKRGFDRWSG